MVMLLVPAVAMLTVTIIIPVFVVIGMSFYHYNLLDMNNITWNNFANYRAVFKDAEFIRTFEGNSPSASEDTFVQRQSMILTVSLMM